MTFQHQHKRSSEKNRRPRPVDLIDGQIAVNFNPDTPGLYFKDSSGGLLKAGSVHIGPTPTLSNYLEYSTGELAYDPDTGLFQVWTGSTWEGIANSAYASGVGSPGKSAFQSALDNGFVGSETDWLASLASQEAAMSNIVDSAQGVTVTGKIATEGIDIAFGGSINAAGASVDLQGALVSFTGAQVSGLSGEINDGVDLHLNQSTATDGQLLSWDTTADDYVWVDSPTGGSSSASNFTFNASIIPDANAAYDLGSAEYKVRHLFLSDNSIKFGDAEIALSVNEGELEFGGIPVMPFRLDSVLAALGVSTYADQGEALGAGLIEGDVYYSSTLDRLTSVTA